MDLPTIRPAKTADIPELELIANESSLSTWTHQAYIDELKRKDSIILLIETSDKGISGFIVGRIVPGPDAEIYNIGIRQSVRQLGLGRLLLAKFISRCTAANVNNIWLEVRYSNASAVSFYEGIGFRETAVRPAFYSDPVEDARIMKLIISA